MKDLPVSIDLGKRGFWDASVKIGELPIFVSGIKVDVSREGTQVTLVVTHFELQRFLAENADVHLEVDNGEQPVVIEEVRFVHGTGGTKVEIDYRPTPPTEESAADDDPDWGRDSGE